MTGLWGVQKKGKRVHYYPNSGIHTLCGIGGPAKYIKQEWDLNHELTCPSCKHMIEMMKLGFKPVKTGIKILD